MDEVDAKNLDIGITMAISTLVEALGMHWENVQQQGKGEPPAHVERAFQELVERNGCHWNAVTGRWRR